MRAILIDPATDGPEALVLGERPDPTPGPGQVLIRVEAAGVNRPDVLQRRGLYAPPPGASDVPGLEVAGEIAAVGESVARWSVGDRVCALLPGGGYAELAVADEGSCLPIPDVVDAVQAAGLPETVMTVFANVFEAGGLKAGETLLVHGATSGIGVTAIQMARAAGARVIATSRGADKAEAARALGADVAIDASAEDWAEAVVAAGGADVALDMVGAAYAAGHARALKPGGRWVVIATQAGARAEIDLMQVMLKRLVLTGSTLRSRPVEEKARLARAVEATVWPWVIDGRVRPPIETVLPLDQAAEAHRRMEAGGHVGKIVLAV
ncbi:NAD(P)H-quinone oxidoreductase [Brevundimonas lutea]|uniref:NAD(P)H-quinone oxidoreductase n=1 Tax=Brevundimonas lutea TaxID=2293980 RepID=UPI000F02AA13|nr:NAD(P)H-quinone oxidoreductase [Brevundimonas lutea]